MIAAGGTGGHVFPALAVAQSYLQYNPKGEVLFIGATGGREVEWVNRAGYPLQTIWISGFYRQEVLRNLTLPIKFIVSHWQAWRLIKSFRPQVVLGFGGYPSYPPLHVATRLKIPTVLHESNAYPGLVNRLLADKVSKVLIGNLEAKKRLPKGIYTGNPVRKELGTVSARAALEKWNFSPSKPVLAVFGGSLGAKSINLAVQKAYPALLEFGLQILWQCGRLYYPQIKEQIPESTQGLFLAPFIEDMAAAYACASLVVARAGAITLAELVATQKPAILIPSPNVAENHQYHNALSLSEKGCALLIQDKDVSEELEKKTLAIFSEPAFLAKMQNNIRQLEKSDASAIILKHILELVDSPC